MLLSPPYALLSLAHASRVASWERRSGDDCKRTSRHIDTQHDGHEGMELRRGVPERVDADTSRLVMFSITYNRSLLSTLIIRGSTKMAERPLTPLMLVLPVARIL